MLLSLYLRTRGIERYALTNDEVFEVYAAESSFSDMLYIVKSDAVHPPLDYFLQFALTRAGAGETMRRVPSIVAGVLTVGAVMLLGSAFAGPAAGACAGLLLAVAPMHVRYSQEIRPYSIALLFLCASVLALERYARRPRAAWALAWAALVYLSAATLYFAGLVAGVTGMVWIFVERRGRLAGLWKRMPLVIAAWLLLYTPWLGVIRDAAAARPPKAADMIDWSWWRLRLHTYATGDYQYEPLNAGSWAFWLAVLAGTVAAVRSERLRPVLVWMYLCGALQILALQVRPHFDDPRYVMSSMPAAYLLAGAGVALLFRRIRTAPVAIAVLVLFTSYSAIRLHAFFAGGRPDWRSVASWVHDRVQGGDKVVTANEWARRNFGYYWRTFPARPDVVASAYRQQFVELEGPAWIVSGVCTESPVLAGVGVVQKWPQSDDAKVRYLRAGERMSQRERLCR